MGGLISNCVLYVCSVRWPEFSFVLCPAHSLVYMAEMLSVYMQRQSRPAHADCSPRQSIIGGSVSRIVLQQSVVLCPVKLSTVRLFLSTAMLSKRLVSYSSSLLLGLLPQKKLLPKPTLRSFSCCRCRVGCAVAQNFVRKRRLPATQQHFSPFCLLNHSTSFLPTRIPLSFVDLVCCHTFQRHVRRNFYVPGHIWSQRYIWCHVSKND